ncbi:hypothetical protein [Candidatus Nesciobacter abundans]|uniref:Uncharacterized protein n=1 Tax=Candidatus Nesciobacter abundans TaxID=2601668 RepID=A0A5C0UJG7_9PROT|nr:hypothetical protein [Candidatus Nesciobacter abundans]QEK38954.1 hypothetical protein FZC36_00685 [Candidatus Nesciobacter abundans]
MNKIFLLTQIIAWNVFAMGNDDIIEMHKDPVAVVSVVYAGAVAAQNSESRLLNPVNHEEDIVPEIVVNANEDVETGFVIPANTNEDEHREPFSKEVQGLDPKLLEDKDRVDRIRKGLMGVLNTELGQYVNENYINENYTWEVEDLIDALKRSSTLGKTYPSVSIEEREKALGKGSYRVGYNNEDYSFYIHKVVELVNELFPEYVLTENCILVGSKRDWESSLHGVVVNVLDIEGKNPLLSNEYDESQVSIKETNTLSSEYVENLLYLTSHINELLELEEKKNDKDPNNMRKLLDIKIDTVYLLSEKFIKKSGKLVDKSVYKLLSVKNDEFMRRYISRARKTEEGEAFFEGIELSYNSLSIGDDSTYKTKVQERIFTHFCENVLAQKREESMKRFVFGEERARVCAIAAQLRVHDFIQNHVGESESFMENSMSELDLEKYTELSNKLVMLEDELYELKETIKELEIEKTSLVLALKDKGLPKQEKQRLATEKNAKQDLLKEKNTEKEVKICLINEKKELMKNLCPLKEGVNDSFQERAGQLHTYLNILEKNHNIRDTEENLFIKDNGFLSRGYFRILSYLGNMAKHALDPYEYELKKENDSGSTIKGTLQKILKFEKKLGKVFESPVPGTDLLKLRDKNENPRKKMKYSSDMEKPEDPPQINRTVNPNKDLSNSLNVLKENKKRT